MTLVAKFGKSGEDKDEKYRKKFSRKYRIECENYRTEYADTWLGVLFHVGGMRISFGGQVRVFKNN